jgi:hypothetical protein
MSSLRSVRTVSSASSIEAHVHLDAANGRQVVTLGVEEQRLLNMASAESMVGGSPGRMTR